MRKFFSWLFMLTLVLLIAFPAFAIADTATAIDVDVGGVSAMVGSALFVVAAVNGLKRVYNLSGQILVPVAMLLGVSLQLVAHYLGDSALTARILTGIMYGGGASGLWVLSRSSPDPT